MGQLSASSTSSSLIRQVQADEPEALNRLCSLYAPLVVVWCRQAGLQPADTADIVQDVFISVCQNIGNFRRSTPGDSFRGWLWTIARNAVRLHLRKAGQQPLAAGGSQAQAALQTWPEFFEGDADGQRHALLHRALQMLRLEFTETTWQAFWRTAVDRVPSSEVAAELGLSPGAVRQAKYAVLLRLRDLLADE